MLRLIAEMKGFKGQRRMGRSLSSETLTLGQFVELTHGKPSTLKLCLKELVQHGHLPPKGQGRGAHYVKGFK